MVRSKHWHQLQVFMHVFENESGEYRETIVLKLG